ncbi:aldo/keto reductase [Bacillus horti]|uniref:Aryl-alcohol dehydrogenase-like predicted oxidoreductase n=1 Tax=Caldalkalibacillus horti TaxID=77523 RepID=A0ABT9VV58_9BACI|nr:aldo/keto reductase [Bacillus horti]MDQ0164877.1 aryl-alcohol dehydrogenase-like predicted oxidoreductase [Bacillus horti]
MNKRRLGQTDIEVSAVGFGCWAIGGPFWLDGLPDGWGDVNDEESIHAIETALEHGVHFFDTADVYGTGRSEEVIGRALKGRRHEAIIATKFGFTFDPQTQNVFSKVDVSPAYIRSACTASLRRLDTDYIDLYQVHAGGISNEEIDSTVDTLEQLQQEGLIRSYGFSTGDMDRAEAFAKRASGASTIQHPFNVLLGDSKALDVCEQYQLSSINNAPLAMGLLSGKFDHTSHLSSDDVRGSSHEWVHYFKDGKPKAEFLNALDAVREILTSGNRTLVQGALAWIWGKSDRTIPIPGLKKASQVEVAAKAMSFGPLSQEQLKEIDNILKQQRVIEA